MLIFFGVARGSECNNRAADIVFQLQEILHSVADLLEIQCCKCDSIVLESHYLSVTGCLCRDRGSIAGLMLVLRA